MARKSVSLIISGILLFSISASLCFADEDAEINRQKEYILSLIEKGKFSEAKTATEKMTNEFPGSAKLPDMLYWIAGRFQTFDRFGDAKQIQEQIIRNFPDSPWALKARMGSAMTEATSLIMSGKFAEAKEVTAQMAVDFAGNPDLPEALFWITERYIRVGQYEQAKKHYQQIIENYPNSPFANKAKLFFVRSEAMTLIASERFDEAQIAIDKMFTDFAGNPDLPEAIYWTVASFEPANRFEELKNNYQKEVVPILVEGSMATPVQHIKQLSLS